MGIKDDIEAMFASLTPSERTALSKTVGPARPGSAAAANPSRRGIGFVSIQGEAASTIVNNVVTDVSSPFSLDQPDAPTEGPGMTAYIMMDKPSIWRASHTRNFENFAAAYPRQWWALSNTAESPTRGKILATIWKTGRLGESFLMLLWKEAERLETIHNNKLKGSYHLPKKGDRITVGVTVGRVFRKPNARGQNVLKLRFTTLMGWAGHLDLGEESQVRGVNVPDPDTPAQITAEVLWIAPSDYVVLHGGDEGWRITGVGTGTPLAAPPEPSFNSDDYD